MKKIIILLLAIFVCCALSACSGETKEVLETQADAVDNITTQDFDNNIQTDDSSSDTKGSLGLEDVTSEYVEPSFKTVSTLEECYDYFEPEANETVTTQNNEDGSVSLITLTDKNGNTKATMQFKYEESIIVTISYYENDEVTEKVAFSFYDDQSISIISHTDAESNMCFYFYNEDGTFNSYLDGAGLSSLLVSSVFDNIGGSLSQ